MPAARAASSDGGLFSARELMIWERRGSERGLVVDRDGLNGTTNFFEKLVVEIERTPPRDLLALDLFSKLGQRG